MEELREKFEALMKDFKDLESKFQHLSNQFVDIFPLMQLPRTLSNEKTPIDLLFEQNGSVFAKEVEESLTYSMNSTDFKARELEFKFFLLGKLSEHEKLHVKSEVDVNLIEKTGRVDLLLTYEKYQGVLVIIETKYSGLRYVQGEPKYDPEFERSPRKLADYFNRKKQCLDNEANLLNVLVQVINSDMKSSLKSVGTILHSAVDQASIYARSKDFSRFQKVIAYGIVGMGHRVLVDVNCIRNQVVLETRS